MHATLTPLRSGHTNRLGTVEARYIVTDHFDHDPFEVALIDGEWFSTVRDDHGRILVADSLDGIINQSVAAIDAAVRAEERYRWWRRQRWIALDDDCPYIDLPYPTDYKGNLGMWIPNLDNRDGIVGGHFEAAPPAQQYAYHLQQWRHCMAAIAKMSTRDDEPF